MASFQMISMYLISDEDYSCGYYFLCRSPILALLLCSMTHYAIKIGNDITRDDHCDVTMHNDVAMSLFYYVLLCPIMILLLS